MSSLADRPIQAGASRSRALRARARGASPAIWVLAVLVLAGIALRVVATASWWPAITTLADSWPYAAYADGNPLADPQHPAGYPALLALLGGLTRDVSVHIIVQHAGGIASALLLYAAVRRLTGSPWPGLLPAAVVLLNADQIFLEHTIMSEGPFVTALAATLYATVRAMDEPVPVWKWPLAAGVLAVVATVIRSAGLFFIPIAIAAVFLARPLPWRERWRGPVVLAGISALLLLGYAGANLASNDRFEVGPTQGWHLYGRVAPFADCRELTPPRGTAGLCESTPVPQRFGNDWYLYDPASPAIREFGPTPWNDHDAELGAFARQVIIALPRAYASAMWQDVRAYFAPGSRTVKWGSGGDLDPQLDWSYATDGADATVRDVEKGMQLFFDPFVTETARGGRQFLHDYQRIFRFGATMLTIMTVLCLVGLVLGPRRARLGVLLFGVGGLALLVAPTLSVYYVGRYSVPVAGPVTAGAAIALWSVWTRATRPRPG